MLYATEEIIVLVTISLLIAETTNYQVYHVAHSKLQSRFLYIGVNRHMFVVTSKVTIEETERFLLLFYSLTSVRPGVAMLFHIKTFHTRT